MAQISLDYVKSVHEDRRAKNTLVLLALKACSSLDTILEALALTVSSSEVLHDVGRLSHEYLVTGEP